MKVLEVKDLSFSYPDKSILHRLSFSLDKGDFLCVVGTNGTGKSTLLKLILNQLTPTEGSIKIFDKSNQRLDDYGTIAYVSQKATSFNRDFPATVEEIVRLGLYPQKKAFSFYNKEIEERFIMLLKELVCRIMSKDRLDIFLVVSNKEFL